LAPSAWDQFIKPDSNGDTYRIIEAKRPGVIFTTAEDSLHADSIAVLRVNTSLENRFTAVQSAFKNYGKPYDYNFDFLSDDAFVCSELIFKVYRHVAGLNLELRRLNDKLIYFPNNFAQRYSTDLDSDEQAFKLVTFYDGSEQMQKSIKKDDTEFAETYKRPKWFVFTEQ
jgi:uncharacterized protein YycO